MPVPTKSGLFAKVKNQAAAVHKDAAAKPIVQGNAGLPAGIENGIAQLVDMHFGEYKDGTNKGKLFFMAAGIVKEPKIHEGVPIEGQRTQIGPLPLCDTPQSKGKRKSFQDNYDYFLNELKKFEACPASVDVVEETVAKLVKIAPHFRFRTWKGDPTALYPNPRVNHEWLGLCQAPVGGAVPGAGVVDSTGSNGAATGAALDADGALSELAAKADSGDEEANLQLQEIASKHGLTEEDLADTERFPNWKTVVEHLTGAGPAGAEEGSEESGGEEGTEESESSEESGPTYAVGSKCRFKPLDPKDKAKKKRLAAVECEITAVDDDKKVLTLKNGKMSYKGVKFDLVELV